MVWTIKYTNTAKRKLVKLDKQIANRILTYMEERVVPLDNPRSIGKALKGSFGDYWRYRVGDYRVICDIQDEDLVILVITVGHRSDIY